MPYLDHATRIITCVTHITTPMYTHRYTFTHTPTHEQLCTLTCIILHKNAPINTNKSATSASPKRKKTKQYTLQSAVFAIPRKSKGDWNLPNARERNPERERRSGREINNQDTDPDHHLTSPITTAQYL